MGFNVNSILYVGISITFEIANICMNSTIRFDIRWEWVPFRYTHTHIHTNTVHLVRIGLHSG